jgi:hypothetical protein
MDPLGYVPPDTCHTAVIIARLSQSSVEQGQCSARL